MNKLLVVLLLFSGCAENLTGGTVTSLRGVNGPTGSQSMNGVCTVTVVQPSNNLPAGGSLFTCADGTQALVPNGYRCNFVANGSCEVVE
jgi:hypothetical protein